MPEAIEIRVPWSWSERWKADADFRGWLREQGLDTRTMTATRDKARREDVYSGARVE